MPASQLGWAWQLEKNRGKAATRRRGPAGTKKAEVNTSAFLFVRIICSEPVATKPNSNQIRGSPL